MNKLHRFASLLCCAAIIPLTASCLKDEAPNAECDIEEVSLTVEDPESFFFNITDMTRTIPSADSVIVFQVRRKADVSALAPTFKLTPGASITPESGSVQDFSNGPVAYTVTSQDGQWKRRYRLSFNPVTKMVGDTVKYDFSDDMRTMQYGVGLGCDWFFLGNFGLYADLEWGLTGIHHSAFKTVEQKLFPIYGTLGLTYRF